MKELHVEGLATHDDPESCAVIREDGGEAFDRGTCGLSMELRKRKNWSADAVRRSGRQHGRRRKREHPDGSPESETSGTHGNSWHGNQEIPVAPLVLRKRGAGGGTHKGTLFTNAAGKSDHCEVPEKALNKGRKDRRRGWREGGGSRRTAWSNTRTRHRAG